MKAEILSTGDEVRSGATVDSNAAWLASELEILGVEVVRHTCVGDDPNQIGSAIREIALRADTAVVTGGLGPTEDDRTAEAAALAAKIGLVFYDELWEKIRDSIRQKGLAVLRSHEKQAMIPKGAMPLDNSIGTAPGFLLKINGCKFFFLPGVPLEMKMMFKDKVAPLILKTAGRGAGYRIRRLTVFGLTESGVDQRLKEITPSFPELDFGLRVIFPEIQIRLYARHNMARDAEKLLDAAARRIKEELGPKVVSDSGSRLPLVVADLMKKRGATLAVAESCTGGLISNLLTDIAGSSAFFLLSAITYDNEAKMKLLGVKKRTLERFGAVSEETAMEMANGARLMAGSDFAISTTGIAGPGGAVPGKPVGTVCIGVADRDGVAAKRYYFAFANRLSNKKIFAYTALNRLRLKLLGG